jgi:hypothetical protein
MKHILRTVVLLALMSCINTQPYRNTISEGNYLQNKYLKLKIPDGWHQQEGGNHLILVMQKKIDNHGELAFPTVILEVGTINDNSFNTNFDNIESLVRGFHKSFSENEIYSTSNRIDTTIFNGIQFYSFETKLINRKLDIADVIQTHYLFNIDTTYFHLSVSDYDRFEELKKDYIYLLKSIERK